MMLLLRHEQIVEMLATGSLIDGRWGGLVVGPTHEEGNIYLLHQTGPENYEILGSMEGGEYLFSHMAYRLFHDRIDEINAWEHPANPGEIEISASSRIINACGEKAWKTILIDRRGQFIVNKWATSRFFPEIDELNRRAEDYPDVI